MKNYVNFYEYLAPLLLQRNISDRSCRKNQKTYFVFNIRFFFFENRAFFDVKNFGRAKHATDDNTTNALCVLDN